VITDTRIYDTVTTLIACDPDAMITPCMVYHAMDCQPDCRGCMPNFVKTVYSILQQLERDGNYLPPEAARSKPSHGTFSQKSPETCALEL